MKPTVEELTAALGSIYGPSRPVPVDRHRNQGMGWGGSGASVESFRLAFGVGPAGAHVEVETSCRETHPAHVVSILVAFGKSLRSRRLRFPLVRVIAKEKIRVPVDGRQVPFSVYSCGREARAIGIVRSNVVTVATSRALLRRIRLSSIDPEQLAAYIGPEEARRGPSLQPHPRYKKPSARAAIESFGTCVVGLAGRGSEEPLYPAACGQDGETVNSVHLYFKVGSGSNQITVDTEKGQPDVPNLIANLLIHRVNAGSTLRFPMNLTVTRERISLPIDGQATGFTAYTCAGRARAIGMYGGNTITVECPASRLRRLSLKTLDESELRRHFSPR